MINSRRILARLLWSVILFAVLLSMTLTAGPADSLAANKKHRYVIMQTRSRDSYLEKNMHKDFLNQIKGHPEAKKLAVSPWTDTDCKDDDAYCDRITIDTETRTLIFECKKPGSQPKELGPCGAAEKDKYEVCIKPLPRKFTASLWTHSNGLHQGEDW